MLTGRSCGRALGVTLIELMVTVAALAVGLSIAAPSLGLQLANYRVRNASEGIVGGLNFARSEALRRNASVSFTLDASGAGWSVALVNPATTLRMRANGESPGVASASSTTSRVVVFLATGFVDNSGLRLSQISLSTPVANADSRQIDIFGGGLIRVCDPAVNVTGDPRRC